MRHQGKKTFILTTLIVYLVSLFTQQFSVLFEVRAQTTNIPHINIVTVFVDDSIYEPLKSDIQWYATQYIQQEIPESKALVMPINLKNIDAPQIYKMLENIYFDGLEGANSTLLGVILIGNIPLPVINQDGYIFPSIYPYVDFVEQKYLRDPTDQYFIPNGNEKGQAEIWHGLINYDNDITAYQNFFQKIKTYKTNPQNFIGKDIWYEDFIANKNGFLEDNLQFYQNKILFSEDIAYQRFTPLMLRIFQGTQNEGAATLASDLADTMKELGGNMTDENGNVLDIGKAVAEMGSSTDKGLSTKVVEKTIKDSFLLDYPKVYSTKNAVTLRDNVMAGGRWLTGYTDEEGAQLITRADSSIDKINLKDIVNGGNESVQGVLMSFNTALENAVDQKIKKEKYDMDIVLPVSYATTQAEKVGGCKRVLGIKICKNRTNKYLESNYEIFYFGKSANLIQTAQELSIYRGSFRNLSTLSGITYTALPYSSQTQNPIKTNQDNTNLQNKSLGASYDIFSTQVEANRGYNLLNTQDEYDNYEKNKSYAERRLKCDQWRPFPRRKMVCTKVISEPIKDNGGCYPYDKSNDPNDIGGCETITGFTQRRRGGASPLNLDFDKINEGIYNLAYFNGKNALSDIFDIAGSKILTTPQSKANTYKSISEYASPTALQISRKANSVAGQEDTQDGQLAGKFVSIDKRLPDEHLTFKELDFFTIYNNGKDNDDGNTRKTKSNAPNFELYRETNGMGKRKENHTFKVISSQIKNISTIPDQLNGITTTKFGTGSHLTNYYQRIIGGIDALSGTRLNASGINDEIKRIGNEIQKSLTGINQTLHTISNALTGNIDFVSINTTITGIQNILRQNKFSSESTSSLEDLNNLLETVGVSSLLNMLKTIETTEYETLNVKKQKIEFASGRLANIRTGLAGLQNTYTTLLASYKEQYHSISGTLENLKSTINTLINHLTMLKQDCTTAYNQCIDTDNPNCTNYNLCTTRNTNLEHTKTLLNSIIGTTPSDPLQISTDGINFGNLDQEEISEEEIKRISEEIRKKIPNDINSFFYIKDIDQTDENDTSIKFGKLTQNDFNTTSLTQEITSEIQKLFISKNEDEPLKIEGLNLLTPDRPIDSPRYITFQGINAQEVKFIYPDLYKVEVYKADSNGYQTLKTPTEIKTALQTYLQNKVNEYNTLLTTAKNTKQSMNAAYNELQNLGFKGATPDTATSVRSYATFTYNDLLSALGGEAQLNTIAEMLYYQNLTNTEKQSYNLITEDIDNARSSFDISNKVKYTLQEYLTENNPKLQRANSGLVIPTYKPKGYEVAYINSDEKDRIIAEVSVPTRADQAQQKIATKPTISSSTSTDEQKLTNEKEIENECGIPADGSVLLFDIQQMNSPRITAFGCRLKKTLESPLKIELNYSSSLGPTIGDPNISSSREAAGEYFTDNFTQRGNAMQDFGEQINTGTSPDTALTQQEIALENANQASIQGNSAKNTTLSQYYAKIKTVLDTSTLDEKHPQINLTLTSSENVGTAEFIISLTGTSCLQTENINLCTATRKQTFNSKTSPKILTLSQAGTKAGNTMLLIKICIPGSQDCITKTQRITIKEGPLDKFSLQANTPRSVVGILTPLSITALDKNDNIITRTPREYLISATSGQFFHEGGYKTSFTTNTFKNLKFYYQAPAGISSATITIEPTSTGVNEKIVSAQLIQPIISAQLRVNLNGQAISSSTITPLQLTNTDNLYTTDTKGIKQLNLNALQKVTLQLRDPQNTLVNIDSEVHVHAKNKLITIGTTGTKIITSTSPKSTQTTFTTQSTFTLKNGQLSFYFYPTHKAGQETLNIEIPGLDPFTIQLDIKPAPVQTVNLHLPSENLEIGETITGTISLTDIWGNRILTPTTLTFTYDAGQLTTSLPAELTIPSGEASFVLSGKKSGISYLVASIKNNQTATPGIAKISIQESLLPTSGLNVLYLNYFGSDRGNQRGYFSKNNKQIEKLMTHSNKLITTTTQLIQPAQIKQLLRGIAPNFTIKNYGQLQTSLTISGTNIQLQAGNIANVSTTLSSPFQRKSISSEESIEDLLSGAKTSTTNTLFFLPSENVLTEENADTPLAQPSQLYARLTDYVIEGYQIRELTSENTLYGDLILHLPHFTITKNNFQTNTTQYLVESTFSNGSSKAQTTIGIFDTKSSFSLPAGYLSIQDSHTVDNNIGFRGDFKNITLFAQGEQVGEATRKYGSELLINLGDPLLKKSDTNPTVYDTDYDGGLGTEVFSNPNATIFKVKSIDFNNDTLKDLLVVYTDGTVKLAKNYGHGSGTSFKNLENLMLINVGIEDVYIGDVDGNNYEDIIIATTTNQLRVYRNSNGKFEVDGELVCLNTNTNLGEQSSTPSNLSVHQIFVEDMDQDGAMDIITNDYKGFIKIFYGGKTNGEGNYLSKDKATCDTQRFERQKNATTSITRFGIQLDESLNIVDNSMMHREGLKLITTDEISPTTNIGIDMNNFSEEHLLRMLENMGTDNIDYSSIMQTLGLNDMDSTTMANAALQDILKYQEITTSYPLGPTQATTGIFVPISYLSGNAYTGDKVKVYKTYKDLNGGILEKDDIVQVTVHITATQSFQGAFGDKIQGPRKISLDQSGIIDSLSIKGRNDLIFRPEDTNFSYLIDNIVLRAGQTLTYTYQLTYQDDIPLQTISLEDIKGSNYGTGYRNIIADGLLDIKLQPVDGCVRYLETFINEGTRSTQTPKKRTYTNTGINLQQILDDYSNNVDRESQKNADEQTKKLTTTPGSTIPTIPGLTDTVNFTDLLSSAFNGGLNLNVDILGAELGKVQQQLEKAAAGLCNGFTFGGNNTCKGLPVPFNRAFLAPGAYKILGCFDVPPLTNTIGKGVPIFSVPTIGPLIIMGIPVPPFRPWNFQGAGGIFGGASSMLRIYVAPTLTLQLGVAICVGPYSVGKALPTPLRELGGNCIVTAIKLPCGNGGGNGDNPEETYDATLINNLSNGNTCNATAKGAGSSQPGYSSTPFKIVRSSSSNINNQNTASRGVNQNDAYGAYMPSSIGGGLINLEIDTTAVPYTSSTFDGTINGVRIEGGSTIKNKIRSGLQQGLRKFIIDNFLDPQIRYIANNLTKMHISLRRPDFNDLGKEITKIGELVSQAGSSISEKSKEISENYQTNIQALNATNNKNTARFADTAYSHLSTFIEKANDKIANPFEQLSKLFNQSKLINIQTKTLTVKFPMIYSEDINAYEIYLRQWGDTQLQILEERERRVESLLGVCLNTLGDKKPIRQQGNKTSEEIAQIKQTEKIRCTKLSEAERNKDTECKMLACEEKIQPLINQAKDRVDKLFQDFENALDSINSNILTLQEYRNFPFELYEWIHVTDRYLAEIASLLNNFFGYVSYRMLSNANRFSSYVDAIILIMNVIQTYQVLIDFSANRSSKCATCTNDTYDQHSCTLSILCQGIKLPIIQIPNFKIPDIILDFSELNLNLDIILPNFNFQPVKIDLPQIPNIPSPPTLQLNIDLTLPNFPSLPAIPELPPPPHLPELPSFIPNIKLELPILPPAPALPEIPHTFEATLKFAEKIGRIYCIIKQGIGLVGEGEVKAKIEQLTERTYEVPRIDKILDLTNLLDFSSLSIKANGFDYEIDAQTNMQFNFSVISDFLDTLTKNINNISTSVVSAINEGTQAVEAIANDAANIAQDCINDPTKCQDTAEQGRNNIEQKRDNAEENVGEAGENVEEARKNLLGLTSDEITYTDYPQAKNRLETVLTYFANEAQQDEATSQKLQNIQNLLHTPSNIQANQQGITTIQQQITQLIHTEQEKIQLAQTTLTQDYDQLLTTLAATPSLTAPSEQKQLAFNLNRFTADTATKQLLTTMEHPYKILLDNKAPIIEGFLNEINANAPELLNMTPTEYQRNKQNLTKLKNQLAGFYQRLQPQYQTTLQTKQGNQTAQKSLVAATTTTTSNSSSQSMSFDPAAYINGIFAPTNSDPAKLTKVVYSELNAEQIGTNYSSLKLNNDSTDDIILWDSHNIYIKYGKQNDTFNGPKTTTTTYFVKAIDNLHPQNPQKTMLRFDSDTRLKIFDHHEEVKNFAMKGQNFDAISFGRKQNRESNVAGYLIKLTDRIDYSPEKEDTNKQLIETYILVLPKDTNITELKLTFPAPNRTELISNEIQNRTTPELREATKNKLIGEIRYFDPNQTTISVILENIKRKRQYARVSTLRNENNTLYISSPWSNQLVAGKQILGDDQGPQGQATLYRPSTKENVSTGEVLEGVIGTHYQLIMHREDNVALASMQQEVNGEMIQTIETTNQTGIISIDNLFFTGTETLQYRFHATDHYGNTTTQDITLNITLPDITITNIEKETETAATITAELSSDIDEGTVTFQRQRNNLWTNLLATPTLLNPSNTQTTTPKIENYPLQPNLTTIQGKYYNLSEKIGLYSKANELIAEIDPETGEITFTDEREDQMIQPLKVNLSSKIPVIQVHNLAGELMFNITLPTKEVVTVLAPNYTITPLQGESFGIFNGGKVIHRNGENLLFIAPNGQIYTEKNLIGTYRYNPDQQTISYLLKESALSPITDTIEVTIKVQPFQK